MKKSLKLLLLASLGVPLFGCGQGETPVTPPDNPPVVVDDTHPVDLDLGEPPTYQEDSIQFHYYRKDGKYTGWDMWLWEMGHDGAAYSWNGKDKWGVIASYPLSKWTDPVKNGLGFLIRKGGDSWTAKDCGGSDLLVDFSLFEKDEHGVYHVYMISGQSDVYIDTEGNFRGKLEMATFATSSRIAVLANLGITKYVLKEGDTVIAQKDDVGGRARIDIDLPDGKKVDWTKEYEVTVTVKNGDVLQAVVSKELLFQTEEFATAFHYDGDDLGATVSEGKTIFKVWSPLSSSVKLRVYDSGTPSSLNGSDEHTDYTMSKGEKGVFAATVDSDLSGKYYTYVVTNGKFKDREICDPYAKSCGVNGLRGMIVDFSKTNPTGWDETEPLPIDRKALTVYETHVADVTSSATWTGTEANRKLFKGMYEAGTTYTSGTTTVKTGFDHIKELGVNAVQLIPIFDQANDELNMTFNWGYNPLNYNCLEGGYSSDPKDGYVRIREFKELVKSYHDAGINIIMDVVYNHVAGAQGSNFDVLMPGYYFRYASNGDLSNGSGCGNETASDNYMMRKFMKDSVAFWTKEYKLGGFRFDLMGLHDIETMNQITAKAKEINPNVVIYGEPWGGTTPLKETLQAKQSNGNLFEGFGQFNDQIRDGLIKGGLSGDKELGWITDTKAGPDNIDASRILHGIKGATYSGAVAIEDPDKTVNYVTCHDNYTLADRIAATGTEESKDPTTVEKMNALANSVVFTSQGTSFMLAGEEMLRTKGGDKNSYQSSYKVNELDYALKVAHPNLFKTYQKLIALKQNLDGLHLDKDHAGAIQASFSTAKSLLKYDLKDTANNRTYRIVHANGMSKDEVVDLDGYTLYWSSIHGTDKTLSAQTPVEGFESIIAYK